MTSPINDLVKVLSHVVKENQELKENNSFLVARLSTMKDPEEREFEWPSFPDPDNEAERKKYHALEQAAIFERAAWTIERHPRFKANFRSAPVARLLNEEAKKWHQKAREE